jgi:sialate O-acetylesterase
MPVFAEWHKLMLDYPADLLRYSRAAKQWEAALARAKAAGQPAPPHRPEPPRLGPGGPYTPGGLWNAMVAPLANLAIRGVIWYQGEANTSTTRAPYYGRLFETLIRDWRRAWRQGDFPFLFVQLANFTAPDSDWPTVREGQRRALALANTAMAVTIDVGTPDNIHPPDKRTVAARLAVAARALAYGEKIESSGPLFRGATAEDGALRVWFDHAAGLAARGGPPRGFELAGEDRKFFPAEARIEGATALVRAAQVPAPRLVRYAWADNPSCNLYNAAGLPASPFRSE